eukprot:s1865_g6.t1
MHVPIVNNLQIERPSKLWKSRVSIISHKLPQALAKGEWTDKSQPLVDTREFRLVAQHLHKSFQNKRILCKAYWEPNIIRTVIGALGSRAAMEDNEVGGASRNAKAEGSGVMLVGLRLTDSRLIGLELVLESPG